MAEHTVIDCYTATTTRINYEVREPESPYEVMNQQLRDLLDRPLWPQFPDGLWLNEQQAGDFYRTTYAMKGLARLLDGIAIQRGRAESFTDVTPLFSEANESEVRIALIELSRHLATVADELHDRAVRPKFQ